LSSVKTCPACGKLYAASKRRCPHCGGTGNPQAHQSANTVKGILVLAGIVLVVGYFIYAAISGSGSTTFSAHAVDVGISPGGRWQVTVSVRNTGSDSGTPDCTITFIDGDGITLAVDSFEGDELSAGSSDTFDVLTGLEPGENIPANVEVDCE
jgi:hypothetical protein